MTWWEDLLTDLTSWLVKAEDAVLGWTDEVGKGLAWVGQGIASIARSIWDAISYLALLFWDALVNAFQAVRNGLTDIGNGIWWAFQQLGYYLKIAFDSFKSGLDWIGNKLYDFGQWIWAGISWIGSQLYNFGAWLWDGLAWVAHTIWDGLKWVGGNIWAGLKGLGQWLWSGIVWIGAQISKVVGYIWSAITGFFGNLYNTLKGWIGGLVTGFNQWSSGVLTGFRDKIDDILFANMMVLGTRKIIENLTMGAGDAGQGAKSFGDVLYSIVGHVGGNIAGAVALPIVGLVCKEVLANTAKKMGGSSIQLVPPESGSLVYLPDHAYTPPDVTIIDKEAYRETTPQFDSGFTPSITHEKPGAGSPPTPPSGVGTPFTPPSAPLPSEVPYYPPIPGEPGAPMVGWGLPYDKVVYLRLTKDYTTASTDESLQVDLTKDTSVSTTDEEAAIELFLETEVT